MKYYRLAFFIVFALYLITLAPGITEEDSGDFTMAGWYFGAAHPTGYPLFILFERLASHIPFGDPAFRMNLVSAFFGALGAPIFIYLLKLTGLGPGPAFWAALLLCFNKTLWLQSVITEVYSLNICLILILNIFALKWINLVKSLPADCPGNIGSCSPYFIKNRLYTGLQGPDTYLFLAWLILGLGMSCHHSMGLAALGTALFVLISLGSKSLAALMPRRLAMGIFFFFTGLTPYLVYPIRTRTADPVWNWGEPSTFYQLKRMFFRTQYDATLIIEQTFSLFADQARFWFYTFFRQWNIPALAAGFAGIILWAFLKTRTSGKTSNAGILFLIYFFLFSIVLILINPFTMEDIYTYSSSVFFLPGYLLIPFGLAFGLDFLNKKITSGFKVSPGLNFKSLKSLVPGFAGLIVVLSALFTNFPACDASDNYVAWDFNRNILKSTGNNAAAFIAGDAISFPLSYLVNVRGISRKTAVISLPSLSYYWYLPQMQRRYPELIDFEVKKFLQGSDVILPRLEKLMKSAQNKGMQVFFSQIKTEILKYSDMVPRGLMYKCLEKGNSPDTEQFHADQLEIFENLQIRIPAFFRETGDFKRFHLVAHGLLSNYAYMFYNSGIYLAERGAYEKAITWFLKAHKIRPDHADTLYNMAFCLTKLNKFEQARKCYLEFLDYEPRNISAMSNLAKLLLDQKKYDQAYKVLKRAVKTEPESAEAYCNLGVLYYKTNRLNQARECWEKALERAPDFKLARDFLKKSE
jgi:tetratricopeptide (TPR) repeat protein